jgi:AbrB family looped-hinge helix DNA binding protein
MSNIKNSEKFVRMNNMIWKKTKVDSKGRTVIPQKVRSRLGLNGNSQILWISVHQRNGKENEFTIQIGVKK